MQTIMLNTIALEPARWTAGKAPARDLSELLPLIKNAGFDAVEVWQHHVSCKALGEVRELRRIADGLGLAFGVLGTYPQFHLHGIAAEEERALQMGLVDRAVALGCEKIKMFLGRIKGDEITPEQERLTAERLLEWQRYAGESGIAMCAELHCGTMFDPVEKGEGFLRNNPALDLGICYQPYRFDASAKSEARELAERFAGKITHVHMQAPVEGDYALLEDCALDYATLVPKLAAENPQATFGIEFVKGCLNAADVFDYEGVFRHAARDLEFLKGVLAK